MPRGDRPAERVGATRFGNWYDVDVDDHAFAMFELEGGVLAQVSSSWASRVKRDDLLQIQVDGTDGSAVCGLHRCFIQPLAATPRPFMDADNPQTMVFDEQWQEVPTLIPFVNPYREGWELFLRHVAEDGAFPSPLIEGAKTVQLAEACYQSHRERRLPGSLSESIESLTFQAASFFGSSRE